jgi:acyl-CoA thioesterase-1
VSRRPALRGVPAAPGPGSDPRTRTDADAYNQSVRLRVIFLVFLGVSPLLAACSGSAPDAERASPGPAERPAVTSAEPAADRSKTSSNIPRIIFLGDSLTAGLGLDVKDNFPSRIQERLDEKGLAFEVVNAGVSGDTSAGGLRRLEWAMADGQPRVLVVALGGNDGLRGLPPEQLEANLAAIIEQGQARGLSVILAGMEAPPNFGSDYTARFRAVYPTLAKRYHVPLIPFLLEGVAGDPAFNQSDGIHPNQRGAQVVADLVWRTLEPALDQAASTTPR